MHRSTQIACRSWLIAAISATWLFCSLSGCAGPNIAQEAELSQSHLDQQDGAISSAVQHLQSARQRLSGQSDPHQAGPELDSGYASVQAAQTLTAAIRQDVQHLSDTAQSLQKQIDAHRNDLLGPRGHRIRNRVVALAILVGIGAALLRFGPLLGGPMGVGAVLAGDVLTVFAVPILRSAATALGNVLGKAWSLMTSGAQKIFGALESLVNASLGSSSAAPAPAAAPSPPAAVKGVVSTHAAATD